MKMEKIITTFSYGLCVVSLENLQEFLREEKIRSKKLLSFFQKKDKEYLLSQERGIWMPIPQINAGKYIIRVKGIDMSFDDEFEEILEYAGFNINITNGIWIGDIELMQPFEVDKYVGDSISYQTIDGYTRYSGFKYDIPEGRYRISVKGYARKKIEDYKAINYGFQFEFVKVDEFDGYKNPREEQYNFNVASLKLKMQGEI